MMDLYEEEFVTLAAIIQYATEDMLRLMEEEDPGIEFKADIPLEYYLSISKAISDRITIQRKL